MVQTAEMQSGGKVCFKRENSHPSEANRKEHKLQQARWRAGEGRINSKNKDIKANDQPFYQAFKRRRPGGKVAAGQGTGISSEDARSTTKLLFCLCVVRSRSKSLARRGWGGEMHFWWRGRSCALKTTKASKRATGEETMFHCPRDRWTSLASPKAAKEKAADHDLHHIPGDHSDGSSQALEQGAQGSPLKE